jgi:hypothetical protein
MFELEPDDIADLKVRAAALHVPNSPFQEAYPILLGEAALGQQEPAGPTLTAVVKYEDGTAIVLASTRYLTTREIMDPADLPEAAAAELSEFSEVIGVRHQRLEAIDMLWIPDNGDYVELRADYPFGMQQRQGIVALERAAARLEGLLGRDFLVDQVNFFPVIQSLYDAAGDGAMVELGFMVSGSAQKLEKTRRDGQCCRVEAYHLGGVGVLDAPIQPYRTSVIWDVALGDDVISRPEISIRGTSLQTAEIDPVVGEMVVRNCAGFLDYEYVRDRIISHL